MSGKSAGRLAYEALHESIGRRQPDHRWLIWENVNEVNDGIPGEPLREDMEAAAAAVETEQVRLARADRDQLRKHVLDLAARWEDDAVADEGRVRATVLSETRARTRRQCAADLRHAAGPPS